MKKLLRLRILEYAIVLVTIVSLGCVPKPQKQTATDHVNLPIGTGVAEGKTKQKAVWFATSNYANGGMLGRLDLETGDIQHNVLPIGPDAQIYQDGEQGLFLLTRMHNDALTLLSGREAKAVGHRSLPEAINPQMAARDSLGRVWLTALDSNRVEVLSPNIDQIVGTVDLSTLIEDNSPDQLAEPAQVIALDEKRMAITAARLRRGASYWPPDAQSGLAIVNIDSLKIETQHLMAAPNPTRIFTRLSPLLQIKELFVVGSGDLWSMTGAAAGVSRWSANQTQSTALPSRVLAADTSDDYPEIANLAWSMETSETCIQSGARRIACERSADTGGYIFNRILRYGDTMFVSYIAFRNAQLWVVPMDGTSPIQKIDVNAPIESLSFGP